MKKRTKQILALSLCLMLLCSCENFKVNQAGDFGENSTVSESVINSESENVASESAVNSEDYPERSERESKKKMEQASADSYNYWKKLLNNEYDRVEIDFIVNWLKDKYYFEFLSFQSDGTIETYPDNKKIRSRVQSEENFVRVMYYLKKEKLEIWNQVSQKDDSQPEQVVRFHHKFDMGVLHGEYCLIYVGNTVSKKAKNMDKLVGDYYEGIIFSIHSNTEK